MSARLLPRPFALRNVSDVEGLCRGVLNEVCSMLGMKGRVSDADYAEALTFVIGEAWIQESRYRPEYDADRFPAWLYGRLRFRLIDHFRSRYGRNGQHRLPDLRSADVSGDDAWHIDPYDPLDDRAQGPLERVVAELTEDGPECRTADVCWSLSEADRRALRQVSWVGGDAVSAAETGDSGADRELVREAA